jgi:hypothetical protein
MPINGISVGKDITVTFNDNNGNVVTTRVKMFSAKQKTSNRETVALDGVNRHLNIPMGWSGSIEAERTGPELEAFIFNLEQIYVSGAAIPLITITETIQETNGSVTQWQYQGCVVEMDSSGEWKGDDYITQKINFMAQAKIQQA